MHMTPPLRVLAAFVLAAASGCLFAEGEPAPPTIPELAALAKKYKIGIATTDLGFPVKTAHGAINGKEASEKELASYVPLFVAEFGLYPTDLVKRTKLRRVVLCKKLSFARQLRNGIPDYEHDTLYLEVSRGSYNRTYLRKVVHHEFYHIVDYRDDGFVYTDERWTALNVAKFKYGTGGKNAQNNPNTSVLTDKFPGFLNHYSTTAVEEDKAEVFAHLMVDPGHVEERTKKDRILAVKVKRMKELMRTFCPDVNAKYWAGIRKVKRGDD
jgi:hypothetical protein